MRDIGYLWISEPNGHLHPFFNQDMIKNILFDFGGIFMDITREDSVKAFEQLGVYDANNLLDTYQQTGLFLELESGKVSRSEFVNRLNALYSLQVTQKEVEEAIHRFIWKCEDYKFDFLEKEIPKDIRLLMLSNTNAFIFPWVDEGKYLRNGRAVSSYFEKVYLSFQMGVCKPSEEIFTLLIEDAGIRPEETLFVDDSEANIRVANRLGFVTYLAENAEDWRPVIRKMVVR